MLSFSPVVASADDVQNRFDAAMAALEAEEIYTARRLLRELLSDYPTLYRARLELARADYLARDFDAAEAEVLRVL
jgi:thioredoxin-like negative regulator of GroEL